MERNEVNIVTVGEDGRRTIQLEGILDGKAAEEQIVPAPADDDADQRDQRVQRDYNQI